VCVLLRFEKSNLRPQRPRRVYAQLVQRKEKLMANDPQWERACTQGIPLMLDGRTDEEVSKTLGVSIYMVAEVRRRSGLAWLERVSRTANRTFEGIEKILIETWMLPLSCGAYTRFLRCLTAYKYLIHQQLIN